MWCGDDHIRRWDNVCLAVLESDNIDATSLGDHARLRLHAAMAAVLDGASGAIQFSVTHRPVAADGEPVADHLARAMGQHAEAHRRRVRPHEQVVILVCEAANGDAAAAAADAARLRLASGGITMKHVTGESLHRLVGAGATPQQNRARSLIAARQHRRALFMTRLPGGEVEIDWFARLVRSVPQADFAVHTRPVSNPDALRILRRRLRDGVAQHMVDVDAGRVNDARIDAALDNVVLLSQRLAGHESRPLMVCVTCVVHADDGLSLQSAWMEAQAAWAASGASVAPAHFQHVRAWLSTLPLADAGPGLWKLTDTHAAASLVPWSQTPVADADGYRIGHSRSGGLAVTIDPFATAMATNANVAVLASSGHGKSHALGGILIEATRRGRGVIVVDPETEYRRVIEDLGGAYIDIGADDRAVVNIFETGTSAAETAASVLDLVTILCGGLTPEESAAVASAVRQTTEHTTSRLRVLADVQAHVAHDSRVARILQAHVESGMARMWCSPSSVNLEASLTGFGYRDVPAALIPAVTFVLASWIWTAVRTRSMRRHIVVDEVGLLADHEPLRHLLVHLARRCRKYDASLVVATQNAADLLTTPDLTVVATNAGTLMLGGQRPADIAIMSRAFGLTPAQERFLESATRGEFLLVNGNRRVEIQVDLPAEYHQMLGPSPSR